MENKYVILAGQLSGPWGPVCAQGLPRCLKTRAVAEWGLLSAQHWGKGCTGKYQIRDLGVPQLC